MLLDIDTKDAIKVPRGPISYRPPIKILMT